MTIRVNKVGRFAQGTPPLDERLPFSSERTGWPDSVVTSPFGYRRSWRLTATRGTFSVKPGITGWWRCGEKVDATLLRHAFCLEFLLRQERLHIVMRVFL